MVCTTNRDPYSKYRKQGPQTTMRYPPRFCSSLKVNRFTSARLQGGFAECLGQRWLQEMTSINQRATTKCKVEKATYVCMCRACDIF